jgi:hypothetical protein
MPHAIPLTRETRPERHGWRRIRAAAFGVVLLCAALALLPATGLAQSGRRVSTPKSDPPVPVPTPTPEPAKPKEEASKKIRLLVLFSDTSMLNDSFTVSRVVKETFGRRLHDSRALEITGEETNRNRGDAKNRAKNETERHVVWVSLSVNPYNNPNTVGRQRRDEVRIEFAIYEPATARNEANGTVYTGGGVYGGIGRSRLPTCYPSMGVYDYEIIAASIEAAERVMKSFNLPLPPDCQ